MGYIFSIILDRILFTVHFIISIDSARGAVKANFIVSSRGVMGETVGEETVGEVVEVAVAVAVSSRRADLLFWSVSTVDKTVALDHSGATSS